MRRIASTLTLVLGAAAAAAGTISMPAAAQPAPQAPAGQAPPARAAALDDPTIVAIFDAANAADIETGRLAATRGHSRQVRDFGAMLARDHAQVRQQGRDLARKLGVTPTPPGDDRSGREHAAAMRRLRALRGAAFDRAFLAHEVAFHRSVIDAVRSTLLPAIRNAEVKELVVRVAPAFEAHMLAAQNLQQQRAGR